jgi:hypothetical protein
VCPRSLLHLLARRPNQLLHELALMIYRFKIELDIQADPSPPWDAETLARDYLHHILEDGPLKDHILHWQIKHLSLYPPVPNPSNQPATGAQQERTWQTQRLPQEREQPLNQTQLRSGLPIPQGAKEK